MLGDTDASQLPVQSNLLISPLIIGYWTLPYFRVHSGDLSRILDRSNFLSVLS